MVKSIHSGFTWSPLSGRRRVILIGREEPLLRTRQEILQRAGYDAEMIYAGDGVPEGVGDADVVVLCQTLHEARSETIRSWLAAKGSRAKVLQIVKRPCDDSDRFCSLDGPAAFLTKVAAILAQPDGSQVVVADSSSATGPGAEERGWQG